MQRIKKILMLVFIFIVTLNINYLGMMDKRIIVESSEYKAGNTSNLVLNKILSDNELKTEIPKMFNYTASGTYIDNYDDWNELTNPEYVTNGLYSMEDEDGTSYYFRGNVNNNNVQFGEYTSDYYIYQGTNDYYQSEASCTEAGNSSCTQVKLASAGDKMYWKIIRINGDGSLRLIYNGTSATPDNSDLAHSYAVGMSLYNLEYNDPKYTGYTYDNGTDSFIKKEVDTWYKNTLGSSSYDSKVTVGRFCSDSSGYKTAPEYGNLGGDENTYLYASSDRLDQASGITAYAKPNAPTLSCPATEETYGGSYRLKAGLITADELVLAGSLPYMGGENDSYLAIGTNNMPYLSMSPADFINGNARVWSEYDYLDDYTVDFDSAVRPVINVTTENMTLTGDGTLDNPYMLEEVEPANSYKGKVTIEVGSSIDDIKAFEDNLDLSGVTWTVKDESIARIDNGKVIGLKNGTTVITGVGSDGTTYEIEVTVISNPVTSSVLYIGIGLILILILGTGVYIFYRVKRLD